MNEKLHAWDLDGTIRPGALVPDAAAFAAREGLIEANQFVDSAQPTMEEVWKFIGSLTGRSRKDLKPVTDYLSETARDQSYPWAIEEIQHQTQDGHVIIVSLSPDFLVRAFAKGLDIRSGHGSFFHTKGNVFSGRFATLNKARHLKRFMRQHGMDELTWAAGDSEADVPMLEIAKHATVVNPGQSLAELAIARNWEIVTAERHTE